MKISDFHLIAIMGIISGVLFLACGVFTSFYYESYMIIRIYRVYPCAMYSGFLLSVGIISLIVGLLSLWFATQATSGTKNMSETKVDETKPSETKLKKMVRRSVAIALGIGLLLSIAVLATMIVISTPKRVYFTQDSLYYIGQDSSIQADNYIKPPYDGSYHLQMSLNNRSNATIFDCIVDVSWLTKNGTWLSEQDSVGIVSINTYKPLILISLTDLQVEPNHQGSGGWYLSDSQSVKVEAYGFLKP